MTASRYWTTFAAGVLAAVCGLVGPAFARACGPTIQPYAGPLFDAMAQTDQELSGESAVAAARAVGVQGMALFARVHRRADGRGLVDRLAAAHPDFIVVGAPKLFEMRGDLDRSFVDEVLSGVIGGRYAFVGEILYTHGDKEGGEVTAGGERYIDPTRPQTARLVAGLSGRQVPIMTHWEVYDWVRDRLKFAALYAGHPAQTFVWPHVGFGTPREAAAMLAAHPNLWATLSKKENADSNLADEDKVEDVGGPLADDCDRLLPEWRDVLTRYSDRLMFATDAHKPSRWSRYQNIVKRWRTILAQLPAPVAAAIASGNARRLYQR